MGEYKQGGNYLAIAGFIAMILSKYAGLTVTTDVILAVIGGILALVGIIKQFIDHKKLAVVTGAYSRRQR